jgi:hypothetical protein
VKVKDPSSFKNRNKPRNREKALAAQNKLIWIQCDLIIIKKTTRHGNADLPSVKKMMRREKKSKL